MKVCSRHYADLMSELRKRGLAELCHRHPPAEVARLWLEGQLPRGMFDPFVAANLEILGKLRELGVATLAPAECPLCRVNVVLMNADADKAWMDNVADAMLLFAMHNGLRAAA